jgi:hypothetical protein
MFIGFPSGSRVGKSLRNSTHVPLRHIMFYQLCLPERLSFRLPGRQTVTVLNLSEVEPATNSRIHAWESPGIRLCPKYQKGTTFSMASFFPFSREQFDHAESLLTPADRGGCTFVRNGTEGSNSSHSATQSGLQRNRAALLQESLRIAAIP